MEELPFISISGFKITEPVTMLTDFIIAAACFYFANSLDKNSNINQAKKYFVFYFYAMAAATFLGGLFGHGLQAYIGMEGKYPGWVFTILSMFLLQIASMRLVQNVSEDFHKKYMTFAIGLMLLFLFVAFYKNHFSFVVYHNIIAALFIIPTFAYLYKNSKIIGPGWILFSFLISATIPYFQLNRIGINKWFTYHDVCHTIMLVGLALIFYGAGMINEKRSV